MSILDASMSKVGFSPLIPTAQREQRRLSAMPVLNIEGWRSIIDEHLVEWGRDPSQLEDDGVTAPTAVALKAAVAVALFMRDAGEHAPSRVVPSGDGGVIFESDLGTEFVSLEVLKDGALEFNGFRDGRHFCRFPLGYLAV